jgi:hypothetical protein
VTTHRNHHVNVVVGPLAPYLLCELLAHAEAGAVDRDAVEHRVGARKVNVLEDARSVARRGHNALGGTFVEHRLLAPLEEQAVRWRHIADRLKTKRRERSRLGGAHVLVHVGLIFIGPPARAN